MGNMKNQKFKQLLDEHYQWPDTYTFKFIVPIAQLDLTKKILFGFTISEKESSKGSYVSVTATKKFNCADEIMIVYQKMAVVEGVVSL